MVQSFIGTGCDSKFVDLTCAMLSSLDDNGAVPEATIIVAAFDLTSEDCTRLRLSAGGMGKKMRFLLVPRDTDLVPHMPRFDFPLAMLGCLVVPKGVDVSNARMLVLDSDMIVNSSLRPLFEMDLQGHPIAAVKDMLVEYALHARGRRWDDNYFNTGLLLIDIDAWNARALGERAMIWLAEQPEKPEWPDQDALNHVVGGDWARLDRRWNFAYCGEPSQFSYEAYAAAHIVHFSGAKPTEARDHPAVPIYDRHAGRVVEKTGWNRPDAFHVDRDFVASAYEILLGRQNESASVITQRLAHTPTAIIRGFLTAPEFREAALGPLSNGGELPKVRWPGKPSKRQLYWAADRLPLLPETRRVVEEAKSWGELLTTLIADKRLMALAGLKPVVGVAIQ